MGALVTVAQLEYDPHLEGPYRILAEAARSVPRQKFASREP